MITRIFLTIFIVWLIFKISRWLMAESARKTISEKDKAAIHKADDLVEDPRCHTYIPKNSAYVVSINGKSVYFCSEHCSREYMREEEKISETQEGI